MADLAVRGGRVVLADEVREADILVLAGSIIRIVAPGEGEAPETVDATGLVVLPGVVDAHVHTDEPGRAEWEGWVAATRGAAAGGVTTIADMPLNAIPPTLDEESFDAKADVAAETAVVDHALWGGLVAPAAEPLEELAACGVVGVKAFLCPSGVPEFPHLDDAMLEPALDAASAAGQLVAAHCEDPSSADPRSAEAEVRAIERLGAAAGRTGARVHVVHASSAEAVAAVARVRASGVLITVETCPHYLAFTAADARRIGTALKCAPPIRAEREPLWDALLADRIDLVASDHSPSAAALKTGDWETAWGGVTGIQTTLAVMLTEGVHRRGLPLVRLARLLAAAPARLLGLWPRKGEIRVGADADLVLVDLDREWTLERAALEARSGISPYLGMRFRGRVVRTMVRGRTVYADGRVTGAPGDGWFMRRMSV